MAGDKIYTRKELEDKLTPKERIFCHEYIVDWNKSRAARAAGYSENTAAEIGYENMKKPHIVQYVEFIKNDLEKEAGISKLMVIKEWKKIAFSNITDILNVMRDDTLEDGVMIQSNSIVLNGVTLSDLPKELTDIIGEAQQTKDGIKIKLYCKDNALKQLSELMGWNAAQKIDHTTKGDAISITPMQFVSRKDDKSK